MSLNHGFSNHPPATEAKKMFCAYHRTEFLTNFCLEKQCLMPLCPSCVAEHTEEHYQSNQKPTYINLNQALHEVRQKCYASIVSLEDCSKKNDDLIRYRENLAKNIHEQLGSCKEQIYVKIEQIFQKYESKLVREIEENYRNASLYEPEESQTIREYVNEQIQVLYDKIGVLKSDQCLAGLIRFYDHEQQDCEEGLRDVSEYLNKHKRAGLATVRLNVELLNEKFENLCGDLLSLDYFSEQERDQKNIRNSKIRKSPLPREMPGSSAKAKQPLGQSMVKNKQPSPLQNSQPKVNKNLNNQY